MKKLLILCAFLPGCDCEDLHPQYDWGFRYDMDVDAITSSGLQVDTGDQDVDLNEIDRIFLGMEECLGETVEHGCIEIKIPTDWYWSCDGKVQLLKDRAPQIGCNQKGFKEDPNCPCRWRAGIQWNHRIIVTPDLNLLADPVAKILTGSWYVWEKQHIRDCMELFIEEGCQ